MDGDHESRDEHGLQDAGGRDAGSKAYEIPPEGSLGLLALGAVGIIEWRYARERARKEAEAARAAETMRAGSEEDDQPMSEDE